MYEEYRAYLSTRQLPKFDVDLSACPKIQGLVNGLAQDMEVDKALAFNAITGCISAAVSASTDVDLGNGMVIPTSLCSIIIADSGERKSTVFNKLKRVIYEFERKSF